MALKGSSVGGVGGVPGLEEVDIIDTDVSGDVMESLEEGGVVKSKDEEELEGITLIRPS